MCNLAVFMAILLTAINVAQAQVIVTEVAPSGSSNICSGDDWLELLNAGNASVDMTNFVLHDDNGLADVDTFSFPPGYIIEANAYVVLCCAKVTSNSSLLSPNFGIGSQDTVNLVQVQGNTFTYVSVVGPLPEIPNDQLEDVTYALNGFEYNYTATPTPGAENIMTELPTVAELVAARKAEMAAQNDAGVEFFNMDRQGLPVNNSNDAHTVLDLKISMDDAAYEALVQNPETQVYQEFTSATLSTTDGSEVLAKLTSPGRIRTRGEESLYMAACLGNPLPFRLDFSGFNGAVNTTQSLFGVPRVYLRFPGLFDPSYMRDYVHSRMLARFGLPHVRTRMVNFYINDELQGSAYTLMELPEEEYVFARSFPDWDPTNFALFQTTPVTEDCGLYTSKQLAEAESRVNELDTPPYAFERGNHNPSIPRLSDRSQCGASYQEYREALMADVVLAYLRNDEDCATTLLEEGLLDQELGTDNWDNEIENFINQVMSFYRCDPNCANSEINSSEVDVENMLKTFAFLAVTLNVNSLMGNVNNYYLAQSESNLELWKLMLYDLDKPGSASCNPDICEGRLVQWSITRPTCESLESNSLVGPLLTDETLHAQYMGYVQEFLETVYTNADFIAEIENHAALMQSTITEDMSFGEFYQRELSPDASSWDAGTFPLLPFMKARAESIQQQLDAIEDGTFTRGPQPGALAPNEPWETCADWELDEPNTSPCNEGCQYDGCAVSGWEVESFCDEATGTCYHGEMDERCLGVADFDTYSGMQDRNGMATFCRYAAGLPIKTSECPAMGAALECGASSATRRNLVAMLLMTVVPLVLIAVLESAK